jgi:hypothetical protein
MISQNPKQWRVFSNIYFVLFAINHQGINGHNFSFEDTKE